MVIWWTEKHRAKNTRLGRLVYQWDRIVLRFYAWGVRKRCFKPTFTKGDYRRTINIVRNRP